MKDYAVIPQGEHVYWVRREDQAVICRMLVSEFVRVVQERP